MAAEIQQKIQIINDYLSIKRKLNVRFIIERFVFI